MKSKRTIGFVTILTACLLCFAAPVHAAHETCIRYDASSTSVPRDIPKYLNGGRAIVIPPGALIKDCSNGDSRTIDVLTPVVMDDGRICRFEEFSGSPERFAEHSGDRVLHFTKMFVTDQQCPDRDDGHYIPTIGLSNGVFRNLIQFWAGLHERPSRVDCVAVTGNFSGHDQDCVSFRTLLETRPSRLRIGDVRFESAEQSHVRMPAYVMTVFVDEPDYGGVYLLTIDVAGVDFRILSIALAPF